ncbi:MAG: bifunctional demethylmenaquinone methyltransferase/2-methoxy-6-polyprenyl-1,4-benzoquinol methylase UbiE [Prevotella sp.]|nr:bifunctional demethylmenaquinone methyltransferase/2-methoxy-6-polyprenyl-1,4-benzoquinol methylase UbiE [Prevotella sp.]
MTNASYVVLSCNSKQVRPGLRNVPVTNKSNMVYNQEKIKPYQQDGEKKEQVEHMFNQIAHSYDTLNHRLSWDIDKIWRKKAINILKKKKPSHILDVATGTGDFAIKAAEAIRPDNVLGIDISESMMEIGREKVAQKGLQDIISFQKEDCTNLTLADNSFDAVIAAFGIRNFADLDRGLSEMARVLKPGGVLVILELTSPVHFPIKQLFKIYSHTILPVYGRLISKDPTAYSYLTATIEAFPQGEQMMEILQRAGFSNTSFTRLTFGICTMYVATK